MMNKGRPTTLAPPANTKEPVGKKASGLAHLMSALHQNAAAVVNSKTQLNGPDQILPAEDYTTSKRNGCVKLRKEEHGLGSEEPISVPTLLQDAAEAYPEVVALRVKRDGEWSTWTYERYLRDVQLAARGFVHLGLHRHHSVAIVSSNSPEWVISDLAAIFAGGIAVGLYNGLGSEDISKVATDAKADIIVVENEAVLKKVLLIQHKLPELRAIVQLHGEPPLSDKRRLHRTHKKHIVSWSQLLDIGRDLPEARLDDRLRRVAINHCCTLVYTSGTNRPTRGVMLSHDNLTWCSKMVLGVIRAPGFNRLPAPGEEIVMSYLPHSEIASQTLDIFYTMSIVGTLCFPDEEVDVLTDTSAFFDALADIQPTVFFGPPAAFERIYHRFRDMKRHTSGMQRLILDWSNSALKDKHLQDHSRRRSPARKLSQIQTSLAKNAVCKKYKELIGFAPRTVFLCRGSPLAREVLKYLAGFDIVVHETFGQTENCGLLSANIPKRYIKLGSTGKAVPGVKTRILSTADIKTPMIEGGANPDIGELCGWGRNITMGYINKENETKEVMSEDNWLRLGDLGYLDDDSFIWVLGKADNFITLNSGEVVCPLRIEQLLRLELPCVFQAMIVGDGQDYLAALLTLNTKKDDKTGKPSNALTEDTIRWFRNTRFDMRTVKDVLEYLDHGVQHVIQAGIDRANQGARSTAHMIADWRIMPNQFSYETGELGLTGKKKRRAILEKHAACIGSMFVHPEEHAYNSMCDSATNGNGVPTILPSHLALIHEEDERTSSRNSVDKEYLEKVQNSGNTKPETPVPVIENITEEQEDKKDEDTAAVTSDDDGVAHIKVGGTKEVYRQVITLVDDEEEEEEDEEEEKKEDVIEDDNNEEPLATEMYEDSLEGNEDEPHRKVSQQRKISDTMGLSEGANVVKERITRK